VQLERGGCSMSTNGGLSFTVQDHFKLASTIEAELTVNPNAAASMSDKVSKLLESSDALRAACMPMQLQQVW
jgi:hypothetical protein